VAVDRAFRSAEELALPAPLEHWRELRGQIHELVCALGYDAEIGSFVQVFGTKAFGAALLMMPFLGFLAADGPWLWVRLPMSK
jgi:GH15 family glucan-1,4-alpha-glucosidase